MSRYDYVRMLLFTRMRQLSRYFTDYSASLNSYDEFSTPTPMGSDYEIEFEIIFPAISPTDSQGILGGTDNFLIYADGGHQLIIQYPVTAGLNYEISIGSAAMAVYRGKLVTCTLKKSGDSVTLTAGSASTTINRVDYSPFSLNNINSYAGTSFFGEGARSNIKVWTNGDRNTGTLVVDMPLDEPPESTVRVNRAAVLGSDLFGPSTIAGGWVDNGDNTYTTSSGGNLGELPEDATVPPNTSFLVSFVISDKGLNPLTIRTRDEGLTTTLASVDNEGSHTFLVKSGSDGGVWFGGFGLSCTISDVLMQEIPAATPYATRFNQPASLTELYTLFTDVSPNEWRNADNTKILPVAGT